MRWSGNSGVSLSNSLGGLPVRDRDALDFQDLLGGEILVAFARGADADLDELADTQAEIAEEVGADVDVVRARPETALRIAQHREVFLGLLEHALADQARALVAEKRQQLVNQLAFGMPPWMRAGQASAIA
jgi:hypothetical protein